MHDKVMRQTRTSFTEVYAQSLSVDCDLGLWPSNMVLVRYTSSCHNDNLCWIIFKSCHVGLSYGPVTILEHTNINTHTHAQGKLYKCICPPQFHGRGIKTRIPWNATSHLLCAFTLRTQWKHQYDTYFGKIHLVVHEILFVSYFSHFLNLCYFTFVPFAGIMLEGDVSDIIALDQPTLLFSPQKATKMSP